MREERACGSVSAQPPVDWSSNGELVSKSPYDVWRTQRHCSILQQQQEQQRPAPHLTSAAS
jgi:hypothetical protein